MKKLLLAAATALTVSASAWADLPAKAFPQEGTYYQLQNADFHKIYVGYYPTTGDTDWFICTPTHNSRDNDLTVKDKLDRLASSNVATNGAALDGQLWTFIPGTGDYAGMYAMVCKAYPEGAVRKTMITIDGTVTETGDNNSRYDYIADRTADADDVAWFTIEASGTNYMLKANDGSGNYLTLAGSPKKYELIRFASGANNACRWTPIEYKPDYQCGDAIYSMTSSQANKLTPGKHQVIFQVGTKNVDGFMYPQVPDGATAYSQVYFGGKDTGKTTNSVFPAEYVYTINVDADGKFTIRNYYGYYAVSTGQNSTSVYAMCTVSDENQAEKFTLQNYITTAGYTDRYMIQSTTNTNWQVHMGDNNCFSFYATGDAGKRDAGGFAGTGNTTRTAAAFLMYEAQEVQLSADDIANIYADGVASLKGQAEGYAAMKAVIDGEELPASSFVEGTTDVDVANAAIATDNAAYQAYIDKFNGKFLTLQTPKRNEAYLGIYNDADGQPRMNTKTEKFDDGIWRLVKQSDNSLHLYALTTGYVLSSTSVTPEAKGDGVAFKLTNGNYIVIGEGNNTAFEAAESETMSGEWHAAPAAYTFAQPEMGKYYRILSDRWMSGYAAPNLAVAGENRDAAGPGEVVTNGNLSNVGIYWRLEAGETEGTYKIVNLIDGYSFGPTSSSSTLTQHDGDGAESYIVCAKDAQLSGGKTFSIANSYAVGSSTTLSTWYSFMDVSGTHVAYNGWDPLSDGHSNFENNGSLWYFIAADDAEVEAAKARYIAAVNARLAAAPNDYDNLMQLSYGDAELMAPYKAVFDSEEELSSIDAVNNAKRTLNSTVDQIISEHLIGQHIQLMANRSDWGEHYLIDMNVTVGTGTESRLGTTTDATNAATLWTVTPGATDGAYVFTNEVTGRMIGYGTDAASSTIPTVESDGQQYMLAYDIRFRGFGMHRPVNNISDQRCIHLAFDDDRNDAVKKWSAAGIANSHWVIKALEDAPVAIELVNGKHQLHFNYGTITENAAAKNHCVTIDKVVAEDGIAAQSLDFPITISHDQFDSDGFYELTENLPLGNYTVSVPGGMVTTEAGNHTRAASPVFSVDANGTVTTGIHEISSEADRGSVSDAIYDLQGRRLAAPVKGINIIGGRKVLVK